MPNRIDRISDATRLSNVEGSNSPPDTLRRMCKQADQANSALSTPRDTDSPQDNKGKRQLTLQEVADEEEQLKSRPIDENGKPMDKQIILSERYGKDNPGLAGGSWELIGLWLLKQAGQFVVKEGLGWMKKMILKEESAEQKVDRLIRSYGETGLGFLEDSLNLVGGENMKGEWMRMAISNFEFASNAEGSVFGQAKSMFCTAVCYHLIGEYPNARRWFEGAQEKGKKLNQRGVKDIEDFMKSLNTLLSSYRSDLPTLGYCRRLAIESSSSDRVTIETLQSEKQALDKALQGERNKVSTLDRDKRELQNKVSTLDRDKRELQNKVSTLDQDNKILQKEKQALEYDKQVLQRDKQALQNKVSILDQDNKILQKEKQALEYDKQVLQRDKQALQSKVNTLDRHDKTLQVEKQVLEYNNQILQREKRDLQNKVSTLDQNNKTLQDKNKTLLNQYDQRIQDLEKHTRELTALLQQARQETQNLVESGEQLMRAKQYQKALDTLSQALRLDKNHARARELRGRTYLALRQDAEALEDLKQVPDSFLALVSRGVAYQRLDNNEEAVENFSRAIKQDDTNAEVFLRRGLAYLERGKEGDLDLALLDFSRVGDHPFALAYSGQAYVKRRKEGDLDLALTAFSQAIDRDPKNAIALLERGMIYFQRGNNTLAMNDFTTIIRSHGNHAVAYAERGKTYQAMGKLEKAFDDYKMAFGLDNQLTWVKQALDEIRPLLAEPQATGASSSQRTTM